MWYETYSKTLVMIAILSFFYLSFTSTLGAQELTVDEIVSKTNHVAYYQGKDGRAQVSMTIIDNQGRKRNRLFTILRMDKEEPQDNGEQKFYIYFLRPADVSKMVFMVWKYLDREDDR